MSVLDEMLQRANEVLALDEKATPRRARKVKLDAAPDLARALKAVAEALSRDREGSAWVVNEIERRIKES